MNTIILTVVAVSLSAATAFSQADAKPNILLILADDLGYHDTGFQGSEHIKTPNLDRLAKKGVRFTDGHVSASVCSPSRAGMITGRYQQRFGHEANCPPRPHGMNVDERTLAQALKDCGYRTALFGKWHLGAEPHQYPNARGFDEFWGLREGSRNFWYDRMKSDIPNDPHNIEHNGTQVSFEGHLTDRLGDRAVEYIHAASDKPFFIFLSFTAPHTPLQSKPEDLKALETDDHYAGLVYGMDRNIGRVFQALEKSEKMDNTMIWFLSDNGGTVRQASNDPLAAIKGTKFEGGHRVPFLLYWKDHTPEGKDYHPMVSALDIYPTCVKAAAGTLEQPRPLDGVDLMPYLKEIDSGIPHEQLFWRKLECAAMRDGPWKLIRVEGLEDHLFNLDEDIGEYKNRAAVRPERLERMQRMLRTWEKDMMDPPWKEGAKWTRVRYSDHKSWYEHGKLPRDMSKAAE